MVAFELVSPKAMQRAFWACELPCLKVWRGRFALVERHASWHAHDWPGRQRCRLDEGVCDDIIRSSHRFAKSISDLVFVLCIEGQGHCHRWRERAHQACRERRV